MSVDLNSHLVDHLVFPELVFGLLLHRLPQHCFIQHLVDRLGLRTRALLSSPGGNSPCEVVFDWQQISGELIWYTALVWQIVVDPLPKSMLVGGCPEPSPGQRGGIEVGMHS